MSYSEKGQEHVLIFNLVSILCYILQVLYIKLYYFHNQKDFEIVLHLL